MRPDGRGGPDGMGEETVQAGDLYLEDVQALKDKADLLDGVVPIVSGMNSTLKYQSVSGNASVTGTTEEYFDRTMQCLRNYNDHWPGEDM